MQTLKSKFLLQAKLFQLVRQFFKDRDFTEVQISVLQTHVPSEPTIYPFVTQWQTSEKNHQLFLTTSPEKTLKQALSVGIEPVFGLGQSFRNLEAVGSWHQPEFTMLEWYRQTGNLTKIISDVKDLMAFLMTNLAPQLSPLKWRTVSLAEKFLSITGTDLTELQTDSAMKNWCQARGLIVGSTTTWEQLFNQVFLNEIEPQLGLEPIFLTEFPALISPLSAIKAQKPHLADRFEVYWQGIELGNGNREQTAVDIVKTAFKTEAEKRQLAGLILSPLDESFLNSLSQLHSMPYAGIGLGLERILMLLIGANELAMVRPNWL
ncbi:MAG TPA: hypothetical protein DEP87_03035 [Candidatus Pacebacteria bacterium]|nr:hypothetical protein [Candidatus Paceibacterota bacterium]